MDKKAQGTMVRTLIVIVLALLALFLLWAFYTGAWDRLISAFTGVEQGVVESVPTPGTP